MRSRIMKILLVILLIVTPGIIWHSLADDPAPPPPGGHGENGNQVPAPIDGGVGALLLLGAIYGGMKIYKVAGSERKDEVHPAN